MFFVTDENGATLGTLDLDLIQADGTAMSYALAAAAGDPDELDRLSAEWLQRVGPAAFGYVAAVAARHLAEGVVGPLLDLLDRSRTESVIVTSDMRAALTDARDFALAVSVNLRAAAAKPPPSTQPRRLTAVPDKPRPRPATPGETTDE